MPTNRRGGKLRVVVVDDVRDTANSLATLLGLCGYEVSTAYDGATALSLTRTAHPHCLISDINMPGMDGCELARRVRAEFPDVRLIAVTGRSDTAQTARVREAGFDHQFIKPVEPTTLLEALAMMEQVKELAETTRAIAGEAKQLLTDVKAEVKEVKQEVKELKEEVKGLKEELRESRQEGAEPAGE
jgi:two-component system, OmpR family, response regulator